MRTCKPCGQTKPLNEFCLDKRKINGRSYTCYSCNRIKCKANRDKKGFLGRKNYWLQKDFGITIQDYNQMFSNQEGKCKICFKHQNELNKALAVDHCHITGKIRGLLCEHCNRGLGLFFDNQNALQEAVKYIQGQQ